MSDIINAEICLPIFKQGDDIEACIVRDENDKINTKATIQNYIDLLHSAISILNSIKDTIPENHDFEIGGDTHYIHISGNRQILESMAENNLVRIEEDDNEVDNEVEEYYSENDNHNDN
jgi:hypothetical protein